MQKEIDDINITKNKRKGEIFQQRESITSRACRFVRTARPSGLPTYDFKRLKERRMKGRSLSMDYRIVIYKYPRGEVGG